MALSDQFRGKLPFGNMKPMAVWLLANVSVRSVVVLSFVWGAIYLAAVDESFRPRFADLVYVAVGGYLGQLMPKQKS